MHNHDTFNIFINFFTPSFAYSLNFKLNRIVSCELDHGDAINCRLATVNESIELIKRQAWPTEFAVNYSFQCDIGALMDSPIMLSTDQKNFVPLKYGTKGLLSLSGFSSLYLVNTDPKRFHSAMFNGDCSLDLNINYGPRVDVIKAWQTQKEHLESDLVTYQDAASAYQKLAQLLPAFELLHTVFSRMTEDLAKDEAVKSQFAELKDSLEEIAMTDVSGLDLDQKKFILKLINQLDQVSNSQNCQQDKCLSLVLQSYIQPEDLQKIEQIESLYNDIAAAQQSYHAYVTKIAVVKRQLAELRAKSKGWITW